MSTTTTTASAAGTAGATSTALAGLRNVRQLGGMRTFDGRVTRHGFLWRSGRTDGVDPTALHGAGIRTVVSLRRDSEEHRYTDGPVRYHSCPVFPAGQDVPAELADVYRLMVDACGPALAHAVGRIADSDGPALVHCAAGKDRTGLVAAMVLDVLGVPERRVLDDYLASNAQSHLSPDAAEATGRPVTEALLVDAFRRIRARHGSVTEYLSHHGLEPAQLTRLRATALEP
ncbi:tyrosine-protein phosphatase [Cellulomonas chitinilytica]|nr:tyrosine-protein phosphatase [Cellulomonas chitinilytica]